MVAAQKAGIPIFVTGGIGGVHRGATESECGILADTDLQDRGLFESLSVLVGTRESLVPRETVKKTMF